MNIQKPVPDMTPRRIRMDARDNVAVVANALGLPAGSVFEDGLTLNQFVPQGHKLALADIPDGGDIVRYGEIIGNAIGDIRRGDWVEEPVDPKTVGELEDKILTKARELRIAGLETTG